MPRFVNYRPAGSTAAPLLAFGDPPFTIPVAAGQWEVNDGNDWLPAVAVTEAAAAAAYESWTGEAWFDFSDSTTITQSSGAITVVSNKRSGGDGLTAGGVAGAFQFVPDVRNGRAVARLTRDVSNAANTPRLSTINNTGPLSLRFQGDDKPYVVLSAYAPTDTNTHFVWSAGTTGPQNVALIRRDATPSSVRREVVPGTTNDVTFPAQASGAWRVVAVKHDGKTVTIWDNSLTPAIAAAAQDTGPTSANAFFRVGAGMAASNFATAQGNCDYGEIVVDGIKTDAEIQAAISALATKWGITLA